MKTMSTGRNGSPNIINQSVVFAVLIYNIVLAYLEALINIVRPARRKDIRGKNVLITGSGHGLGRELALKFASQGANLVLVDINEKNNEQVRREILSAKFGKSIKVFAFSADIRTEESVCALAKRARAALGDSGHVDVLINNAGIVQCQPFLKLAPVMIERTLQVNVLAHMWTVKHFLPAMLENNSGHIVAISSIAGLIGGRYLTDYCASKFAVVGFMDSLEREIHHMGAHSGVHLTTVCPTCMSTGMFQTFTSKFDWLLPVLNAEQVAQCVLEAVLTNKSFAAIPSITLIFHRLSYLLPAKVSSLVQEYLDYGVKPHANCDKQTLAPSC